MPVHDESNQHPSDFKTCQAHAIATDLATHHRLCESRKGGECDCYANAGHHALAFAYLNLEEQFEVEREAFRLACRDLQDAHAGFTDIRKHDYEPPDDGDVETLMGWLRGKAKFNGSNPAKKRDAS